MITFREAEVPSDDVMRRIMQQQLDNVVRSDHCYRHFVLTTIYTFLMMTKGKVPVGALWPNDLVKYPEDENFPEELELLSDMLKSLKANHTAVYGSPDNVSSAGQLNEMATGWMALRSVEMSDTPNWYKPSEALVYSLAATNLSGVYAEDIRLPFPAIFMELPRGVLKSQSARGMHDVLCVGLSEGNLRVRGRERRFEQEAKQIKREPSEVAGRSLCLLMIQEPLPGDKNVDDVSGHFSSIRLNRDDVPLNELLTEEMEKHTSSHTTEVFGVKSGSAHTNRTVFNLILGFVLYLQQRTGVHRAPARRAKKTKRKTKIEATRLLTANSWLVGTECQLNPQIKKAVQSGWTTSYKHKTVVSGHAQRYRCGPGDDWHYEVRFKDPYVKGGDGPILGHSYE